MKAIIGEKELEINSIATLGKAMMYLLEGFATALTGTKEELKEELKEEVKQEVYKDILSYTPFNEISELTDWLDKMNAIDIIGLSEGEIKERAVEDALSYTEFNSIEDMADKLEQCIDALEAIRSEVDDVI